MLRSEPPNPSPMSGDELRAAHQRIGEVALGGRLSYSDMARLVGLSDPTGNGKDTIRKWEDGDGPSGPVAALVRLLVAGLEHDEDDVVGFFVGYVIERTGIIPL
jgi:hypothetical protein